MGSEGEPSVRRLRLTLEYDGAGFAGWQRQPEGVRTVQGTVESALARLPGEHGSVIAAGRTDAGVHASAMVAHVDSTTELEAPRLARALNAHLPADAKVLALQDTTRDFHAQYACLYRRYLYRMRCVPTSGARGVALERGRVSFLWRRVDVEAMRAAAASLVGTHDFMSFATQETRSTVRTVHLCELREERGELRLHVAANGFLRNMIRAIVGTLVQVGAGGSAAGSAGGSSRGAAAAAVGRMTEVLAARDRAAAGPNAKAHALYFVEAGYRPWDPGRSEEAVREAWP